MSNYVAILDDKIAFSNRIVGANGNLITVPMDSLYTPYGFLFPTEVTSFNLLDYFEGDRAPHEHIETAVFGVLLTAQGIMYEFAESSECKFGVLARRRLAYGEGARYVKSNERSSEERMIMALHLTNDFQKAHELVRKVARNIPDTVVVMKIDDIIEELQKRKCTQRLPFIKPFRVKDLDE